MIAVLSHDDSCLQSQWFLCSVIHWRWAHQNDRSLAPWRRTWETDRGWKGKGVIFVKEEWVQLYKTYIIFRTHSSMTQMGVKRTVSAMAEQGNIGTVIAGENITLASEICENGNWPLQKIGNDADVLTTYLFRGGKPPPNNPETPQNGSNTFRIKLNNGWKGLHSFSYSTELQPRCSPSTWSTRSLRNTLRLSTSLAPTEIQALLAHKRITGLRSFVSIPFLRKCYSISLSLYIYIYIRMPSVFFRTVCSWDPDSSFLCSVATDM